MMSCPSDFCDGIDSMISGLEAMREAMAGISNWAETKEAEVSDLECTVASRTDMDNFDIKAEIEETKAEIEETVDEKINDLPTILDGCRVAEIVDERLESFPGYQTREVFEKQLAESELGQTMTEALAVFSKVWQVVLEAASPVAPTVYGPAELEPPKVEGELLEPFDAEVDEELGDRIPVTECEESNGL